MGSLFKPVREQKQHLYENVALQIQAVIAEGNLHPGDKLPSERELSEIFGVSRSCIREATKSLSSTGLLRVIHGQGVFVEKIDDPTNMDHLMAQIFAPGTSTMRDLFEMRRLLEPQAAEWAAERRSEEEARRILEKVHAMKSMSPPPKLIRTWEHDTKFHLHIATATKNVVLMRTMRGILDIMAESRKQTLRAKDRPIKSIEEHLAVAEAIAQGDPALARRAMLTHLNNVEADLSYL